MPRSLKKFLIKHPLPRDLDGRPLQEEVALDASESHHLKDVLRLKKGDPCIVADSDGIQFQSEVSGFNPGGQVVVRLRDALVRDTPQRFLITIAQAIPQHRKMDLIAEKASEIGVDELIPLVTERTIVRMESERAERTVQRWVRISEQTVKQSGVLKCTQIRPVMTFAELQIEYQKYSRFVLLHPRGKHTIPIEQYLKKVEDKKTEKGNEKILIAIGPEGGFSSDEIKMALQWGGELVSLNSGVLKTDTAFTVAAGVFKLFLS